MSSSLDVVAGDLVVLAAVITVVVVKTWMRSRTARAQSPTKSDRTVNNPTYEIPTGNVGPDDGGYLEVQCIPTYLYLLSNK